MQRFLLLIAAVTALSAASAQRIFRFEVDSMRLLLDPAKKDSQQIFIWLRMAEFHINKDGEFQLDLDSARESIDRAKAINAVVRSREADGYILLVESLLLKERPEGLAASERECHKALDILLTAHSPLILGKAWQALSFFSNYRDSSTCAQRIGYLEKALACFNQAGHTMLQGICLESLADLWLIQNDFRKCEQAGLLAVQRYKQQGYPNLQGAYILVADAFRQEVNYADAIKYALLSLDAIKVTHDSTHQFCQVNNIVGGLFTGMLEWNKGSSYLEAAYGWAWLHRDIASVYIVQSQLAACYIFGGQAPRAITLVEATLRTFGIPTDPNIAIHAYRSLVDAYSYNGQFNKANSWCYKMLKVARGSIPNQVTANHTAMKFYILSHRYDDARALLPEYRAVIKTVRMYSNIAPAIMNIFRLDSAQHRYAEAIDDLLQFNRLNDSMVRAGKNREIERLQIDYATAEKEHNIQLLQKETEIQKRDITHSNQTRNYSVAAAALLLAVGFGRYRIKQRQTKQLEIKQREITAKNEQLEAKQKEITTKNGQLEKLLGENEWLMREVHHRVKNNLQIITSLLNSQSAFLTDPRAITAVSESQSRVQAMSLIHQKLYKSDDVSTIDMQDYIGDLVNYLRETASTEQRR